MKSANRKKNAPGDSSCFYPAIEAEVVRQVQALPRQHLAGTRPGN